MAAPCNKDGTVACLPELYWYLQVHVVPATVLSVSVSAIVLDHVSDTRGPRVVSAFWEIET